MKREFGVAWVVLCRSSGALRVRHDKLQGLAGASELRERTLVDALLKNFDPAQTKVDATTDLARSGKTAGTSASSRVDRTSGSDRSDARSGDRDPNAFERELNRGATRTTRQDAVRDEGREPVRDNAREANRAKSTSSSSAASSPPSSKALNLLSGRLDRVPQDEVPELVTRNKFIRSALAEPDVGQFLEKPAPAVQMITDLGLEKSAVNWLEQSGVAADSVISPRQLLNMLGVDPGKVAAELEALRNILPNGGIAAWMSRLGLAGSGNGSVSGLGVSAQGGEAAAAFERRRASGLMPDAQMAMAGGAGISPFGLTSSMSGAQSGEATPTNVSAVMPGQGTVRDLVPVNGFAGPLGAQADGKSKSADSPEIQAAKSAAGIFTSGQIAEDGLATLPGVTMASADALGGAARTGKKADANSALGDQSALLSRTATLPGFDATTAMANVALSDPFLTIGDGVSSMNKIYDATAQGSSTSSTGMPTIMKTPDLAVGSGGIAPLVPGEQAPIADVSSRSSSESLLESLVRSRMMDNSGKPASLGVSPGALQVNALAPALAGLSDTQGKAATTGEEQSASDSSGGVGAAGHVGSNAHSVLATELGLVGARDGKLDVGANQVGGKGGLDRSLNGIGPSNSVAGAASVISADAVAALTAGADLKGDSRGSEGSTLDASVVESAGKAGGEAGSVSGPAVHQNHQQHFAKIAADAVSDTGEVTPENRAAIMQQIADKASMIVRDGGGSLRIDLGSPELGKLDLAVSLSNDRVDVRIVTSSEHIQDMLSKEMPRLRDSLAGQNLMLGVVEVGNTQLNQQFSQSFSNQNFGANAWAGAFGQQGMQDRGGRSDSWSRSADNVTRGIGEVRNRVAGRRPDLMSSYASQVSNGLSGVANRYGSDMAAKSSIQVLV